MSIDLTPFAERLIALGIMHKPFSTLCREEAEALVAAVFELMPDDDAKGMRDNGRMLQDLFHYRHLAPCPRHNWHWVYRGQSCMNCEDKENCVAWPSADRPHNIKPLKETLVVRGEA